MKNWFKKHKKVIIFIVLVLYSAAYVGARYEKVLIHKVSYMTEQDQSTKYFHKVRRGDFGIPMLSGQVIWMVADILYFVFQPLSICENLFWYIYPREYKFRA